MELTREQQLFQTIINKAWEDSTFKQELLSNPHEAIENLTGEKVQLPEGKTLVVRDQTSEDTIYINIPVSQEMDNVELNEEELEAVAGGTYSPFDPIGSPTVPDIFCGTGGNGGPIIIVDGPGNSTK
ncbi:NHLP leader peptide family RiPP precursor [uncultured Dokdonia sp.]|uniref:NHLP leader peptide family RiPP precursor n=1 Tax=uncultured Dokdonia sp. TaxID=575653 RepID=UPI00260C4C97|nr:NHLP leader peptide family RiPP precursor [uncultured Dokdonia sp.]